MEPTYFKQWSNKRWALMASLHKVIIIGVLSVGYQMLAQDTTGERTDTATQKLLFELEEVESLGILPSELEIVSLKPILLISKKDIQSAPATSHEDLLEHLPQVDVRQRGRHGLQADLSIQGGSFDQSMFLLNGINMSDPQTGHFHMNIPLDLRAINRMEVATGSATRQYGTQAFAGAVNLVTQPSDSTHLSAGLKLGQYDFRKAWLNANLGKKHLAMLASFSTTHSSGYRENTDFRNSNAYLHAFAEKKNLRIHFMTGISSKAFGANAFYSPKFLHQYEEGTTGIAALKAILKKKNTRYSMAIYGRINQDYFLLDRYNPPFFNNNHLSRVSGMENKLQFSSRAGITHTGVSFRSEHIKSSNIGEALQQPEIAWYNDTVLFTMGHHRYHFNLNANHMLAVGPLSLSGGFLIHINSDLAFQPKIYPGIDFRWSLPSHFSIYGSYNRSMRLPTFTDLYYQGPSNVGNPELKPETASTLEFGFFRNSSGLRMDMNVFYRQGRQLIDWIWMNDEKWHTMNLTEVNATGLSLSASYRAKEKEEKWFLVNSADLSYSFTRLNKSADQLNSRYVLDPLRHKLVLGTGLKIARNFHVQLRFNAQDRQGTYLAYAQDSGESMAKSYAPFVLLDLKLAYDFRIFHLFLEANNLLDQKYNDIGSVIQPGRWLMVGFEIY